MNEQPTLKMVVRCPDCRATLIDYVDTTTLHALARCLCGTNRPPIVEPAQRRPEVKR